MIDKQIYYKILINLHAINRYIYCSIEQNIKCLKYEYGIRDYNKVYKYTDLKFKKKNKRKKKLTKILRNKI